MRQIYSSNSLIKHLYRETSITEQIIIDCSLEEDDALKEMMNVFQESKNLLNKGYFTPSPSSIQIILSKTGSGKATDLGRLEPMA